MSEVPCTQMCAGADREARDDIGCSIFALDIVDVGITQVGGFLTSDRVEPVAPMSTI